MKECEDVFKQIFDVVRVVKVRSNIVCEDTLDECQDDVIVRVNHAFGYESPKSVEKTNPVVEYLAEEITAEESTEVSTDDSDQDEIVRFRNSVEEMIEIFLDDENDQRICG